MIILSFSVTYYGMYLLVLGYKKMYVESGKGRISAKLKSWIIDML